MPQRTVAVFTDEFDITADAVIMELNERGTAVFRCDPAAFPGALAVRARFGRDGWTGHLDTGSRVLDLKDVVCAWWRRPTPITVAAAVPNADWVRQEATAGLRGLLAALPWLNHPDDIRAAEHKPLQLAVAAQAGLTVAPTLITNDPAHAREFAAECGPVIYKPLSGGLLDDGRIIYTSVIDPVTLDGSVTLTAHLFQQQIPKTHELRVTVVDGRIFTARIDALTAEGHIDWRSDYRKLRYSQETLPSKVAAEVRVFMQLHRLRFAALDFVVTPDGEYVFLEANPNGQWAWIEDETGLPIAAAIADALERGPHDQLLVE
ncbi:ATP-grasp ribosomal peptide maturase [Actinoplanes couchii]|uniref:ATP-grasp ribosomal peptide maturase n=1 Tax=Actinoplanes couchii TaxID=403638 RepID=A0ABQ3XTG3_9ACTN|nr:ATP-grasp ribosomal peptide maturase [Actinoplanes couchii]MDR6318965.1 ATP-grasp ribosomal peptide maturase [Actinoplanes couchii]GID61814.1 ATP-grasp ribosomal peptide maturase [Actinoplanes couchii]